MKEFVIILIVSAIAIFSLWFYTKHPLQTTVTIRDVKFVVDVAITPKEKEVGLGHRDSLAPNRGMLFVYDIKARYPFWMRDMRFPIDILWIDDRTIVDITKQAPASDKPFNQLPIYHPLKPVDKVLELNAGAADKYGISIGDKIIIKN
ncbi:MAG: DUF192 domain-containing protein [Patescibacteria group bacterium]